MLDGYARWQRCAQLLDGRQAFHPLAPPAERGELRIHRLGFRSEAEGIGAGQQIKIGEGQFWAEQILPVVRELTLGHLQSRLDLRQRVCDDLLVGAIPSSGNTFRSWET